MALLFYVLYIKFPFSVQVVLVVLGVRNKEQYCRKRIDKSRTIVRTYWTGSRHSCPICTQFFRFPSIIPSGYQYEPTEPYWPEVESSPNGSLPRSELI